MYLYRCGSRFGCSTASSTYGARSFSGRFAFVLPFCSRCASTSASNRASSCWNCCTFSFIITHIYSWFVVTLSGFVDVETPTLFCATPGVRHMHSLIVIFTFLISYYLFYRFFPHNIVNFSISLKGAREFIVPTRAIQKDGPEDSKKTYSLFDIFTRFSNIST